MKILLVLIVPLLVSFNYRPIIDDWVLMESKINARKISIWSDLPSLKKLCDFEVEMKLFPLNCIKLLDGTKALNKKHDYKKIETNLNNKCHENSLKITTLNQVRGIEAVIKRGSECELAFLKQKKIILYKLNK